MKSMLLAIAFAGLFSTTDALTLDACQRMARERHPLLRQKGLIERSRDYTLENANRGYLPQLSVSGKTTDQSDPAMRGLETDQTQVVAEIGQTIWDGGAISARKRSARASAAVDAARLETELYALRSRVDQLYFGILSIDEQIVQNDILVRDLKTNLARVKAYKENGVANQADVDALQVEILRARQKRTELRASGDAWRAMLSMLVGEPLDSSSRFERPVLSAPSGKPANNRPELALYKAQDELALSQEDALFARNAPRLGAFLQLGWGKPGLSLANKDYTSFWVAGLRLSWDLGGFYTRGNDKESIALQRETIASRQESFELDVGMETARGLREITKYEELIDRDDEIVTLRTRLRAAAEARVEAGTMAVSDLVREMNSEAAARQERSLHEMQRLLSIATLDATTNDGKRP